MNTLLAFVAVLVGSTLAGRALYSLRSKIRSTALRWGLSAFVAAMVLILSWGIFVSRAAFFPATDDSMFSARSTLLVTFHAAKTHSETALASIEIVLPNAIKIDQDAALDFSISPGGTTFGKSDYEVALQSGKEVQTRTLQPCTDRPISSDGSSQTLCAKGVLSEASAQVRWFVRSEKEGNSFLTIRLPQNVGTFLDGRRGDWSATVSRNGQLITKDSEAIRSIGQDRSGPPQIPATLTVSDPVLDRKDVEIDLRSLNVTFPLNFETTLGVSASNYQLLTNGGAVLSAFLGGGWLWQLLPWLKSKGKTSNT